LSFGDVDLVVADEVLAVLDGALTRVIQRGRSTVVVDVLSHTLVLTLSVHRQNVFHFSRKRPVFY
jgi:chorismate-pyruvate lyase